MEVVGTVAAFVAILVVLVLVHELGHFITAKRAGITVEEFGIGFPPRIGSLTWHGTRYSLNWIPLGGFVRMLGEDGDVEIRRLRESGLTDAEIDHAMEGDELPARRCRLLMGRFHAAALEPRATPRAGDPA
jgi:RIP metalloprotease RseP